MVFIDKENLRRLTSNSPLTSVTKMISLSSAPSHTDVNCYFEDCPFLSTPERSLI